MSDEGTHMTNTIKTGLKATTTIKAGGIGVSNHSRKIAAKRLGHVSGRR